ncbi:MAG: DUF6020 family protein [Eubacteriales bacterium]|nr:DUF6020 family protein [Eubacteriales bacterium]
MAADHRTFKSTLARLLGCMPAGALAMFAFTLSPSHYVGVSDLPLSAGSPAWILYALLLGGLFYVAFFRRRVRIRAGAAALGLVFGVVNYFATTLFAYDTWSFLNGAGAWAEAVLRILGQSAVMATAIALIADGLERPAVHAPSATKGNAAGSARATESNKGRAAATTTESTRTRTPENSAPGRLWRALDRLSLRFPRCTAWRRRHPALAAMLALLLCWSPYLLVFYPGTIIWDMGEMLGGLYGLRQLSTWHPVFTTWLFGGCVWLGRQLAGDNLGAFLFTLLQTLALAYALADVLRFLRRLGLGRGWRLAALLFFGLTPIFGSFAQAVGKDTLYAAALLLFAVRTAEILRFGAPGRGGLIAYAAFALLSCLLRSNGPYVVLIAAVMLVVFGLRGKARFSVGGALAAALALAFCFNGVLVPALNIQDETASGLYSVCFQQSARTLRDHADTVTAEEYAAIDAVLDAEALPALYEANISDPVKYTFRQYGQGRPAEAAALAQYRKTWLSMFAEYPITYLEAFVGGNSGYYAFTPKIDAARTYHYQGGIRFVFETYDLGDDPLYLHTTQIAALSGARTLLAAYSRGWRRVPVLELTLFCPVYTWLLVAAAYSLARRKRWRELLAFLPALLSLGVCLLSPVNDYFRYFLPIVAMAFPLLGLARTGGDEPVRNNAGSIPARAE